MRRFGIGERRARLGVRHALATKTAGPEAAADAVVALHATDPATVYLSVRARASCEVVSGVERALYEARSVLRMLGMRRTMFVVGRSLAPVVQAACSVDIAKKQRKQLIGHLSTQGYPENLADAEGWLAEVEESAAAALAARGSATAQQLSTDEPRLRQRLIMAKGKPYEAIAGVTSRVLFQLAVDGRIVRGRPRGTWISTQYEWSTIEDWLPGGLPHLDPEAARVELARRWLFAFGPAPVADLRWWTGWTAGQTAKALAALDPVEVEVDAVPCVVLPDDFEPVPPPDPWVALLPALDPTPMGWTERGFYLGAHREPLFDRTGNIGPTIWADGRIVGAWAQRPSGEVVHRLLEDVGADVQAAVEAEADQLEQWFGAARVIPKFRTPLEKTLSS